MLMEGTKCLWRRKEASKDMEINLTWWEEENGMKWRPESLKPWKSLQIQDSEVKPYQKMKEKGKERATRASL